MNEVTKKLMCVFIRNGVKIWLEEDRTKAFQAILASPNPPKFVKLDDRMINIVDVVGIFLPEDLEDLTREKRGQWKCSFETWHDKTTNCSCAFEKRQEAEQQRFNEKYLGRTEAKD